MHSFHLRRQHLCRGITPVFKEALGELSPLNAAGFGCLCKAAANHNSEAHMKGSEQVLHFSETDSLNVQNSFQCCENLPCPDKDNSENCRFKDASQCWTSTAAYFLQMGMTVLDGSWILGISVKDRAYPYPGRSTRYQLSFIKKWLMHCVFPVSTVESSAQATHLWTCCQNAVKWIFQNAAVPLESVEFAELNFCDRIHNIALWLFPICPAGPLCQANRVQLLLVLKTVDIL